jgi:serine/threonine protein kinase
MTPQELSRIRQIYEAAVALAGTARDEYLDRECQGDARIRDEVLRLVQSRGRVPDWLDQPALGPAKPFVFPEPPNIEGRCLGGYRLLREIGRGGTGVVYLAERSDETFHRLAAIKLVLPPVNSEAVVARFQQEREILASLDHPNIAKLLDAGVTEEGWPFFVMEFVDGQPIHRWCDDRKLSISQRLELFRGVIDAVRFAHQHLVVHRDLKPGNIFVTNEGTVKLLDFGIAKVLTAGRPADAPATLTISGMMTPEYASPEQVNGAAVTTLSDVYSLGVVLYELLTGHRPYRLRSAAIHEMARVISEVEPARPSEIVTTSENAPGSDRSPQVTPEAVSAVREGDPGRLRKRLAGDLDSILLMALRKEPVQRYGSVESLAEDLERHLDQRPVKAREATPWDRFQRYRRRNPGGFLAAVLVAILFLAGLAAVAFQARHDIQAARLDRGLVPFLIPLWLFSSGIALAVFCAAVYFARATRAESWGAGVGGVIWGSGLMFRSWTESNLAIWRSRIEGNDDPLMLNSPWIWGLEILVGAALLLILLMIGRRFGWKAQLLAVSVLGLYQAVRERLWFGEFIPALDYRAGILPVLGSAAMFIAAGWIGLLAMRLISGPVVAGSGRK